MPLFRRPAVAEGNPAYKAKPVGDLSWMRYRTSGMYHDTPLRGGTTTFTASANALYAFPFHVPVETTFDRINCYVTTAKEGLARMGVYKDDGTVYPGILVLDAGTVGTGIIGLKEIAISLTLPPGLYWIVIVTDADPTFGGRHQSYLFAPIGCPYVYARSRNCFSVSFTFAPLPNTFPAGASMGNVHQMVSLRKA